MPHTILPPPNNFYYTIIKQLPIIMIRINNNPSHPQLIHYRNAVIMGKPQIHKHIQNSSIIYTKNHHFIVCGQLENEMVNGVALFFHEDGRYHFGWWMDNRPDGICVFKTEDMLVIVEYYQGELPIGSKILMILLKHNIGVILEVSYCHSIQIVHKNEVYCDLHIDRLINQCKFKTKQFDYTLIKFINNRLVPQTQNSGLKISLIDHQYYRLGYQTGLAIVFDDKHRIKSVGYHYKNVLRNIGVEFTKNGDKIIGRQRNNSPIKAGRICSNNDKNQVNFRNKIYEDPSVPYFQFVQNIVTPSISKQIFAGFIISGSFEQQPYSIKQHKSMKQSQKRKSEQPINNLEPVLQQFSIRLSNQKQQFKQQMRFKPKSHQLPLKQSKDSQQAGQIKNNNQSQPKLQINIDRVASRQLFPKQKMSSKLLDMISQEDIQSVKNKTKFQDYSHISEVIHPPTNQQQLNDFIASTPKNDKEQGQLKKRSKKRIFGQTKSSNKELSPFQTQLNRPVKSRSKTKIFAQFNTGFEQLDISKDKSKTKKQLQITDNCQLPREMPTFRANEQLSPYNKLTLLMDKPNQNNTATIKKQSQLQPKQQGESDIIEEDTNNLKHINQSVTKDKNIIAKRDNQVYKIQLENQKQKETNQRKEHNNSPYLGKPNDSKTAFMTSYKQYMTFAEQQKKQIQDSYVNKSKMKTYLQRHGNQEPLNHSPQRNETATNKKRFNYF